MTVTQVKKAILKRIGEQLAQAAGEPVGNDVVQLADAYSRLVYCELDAADRAAKKETDRG